MTNFEKIKAMGITEMAQFFNEHSQTCDFCLNNVSNGGEGCSKGCIDGFKKYLMSEVTEDA